MSSATTDIRPGDLVAVRLEPGRATLDVLSACLDRGAAVFPIDHRLPDAIASGLVVRAGATLVVTASGAGRASGPGPLDDLAVVLATSGTTGEPKLVELTRGAVEAAVEGSRDHLRLSDEPWVCCLPPSHAGGLLVLLRAVLAGVEVAVHPRFDAGAVADSPDGAWISLVPTALHRLLEAGIAGSRFAGVLIGGAELTHDLRRRAEGDGYRITSTYGLTESCGGVVYDGTPFRGTRARISDDGEVQLSGPTIMRGYRHDRDATAAAFTPDGWLRTNDAGRTDDDGGLHVHGRRDDCIVTGGENVWPAQVEPVLRRHEAVADVAIAGRPDPEWGSRVVAFVVPAKPASPPSLQDIRDAAAPLLPPHALPRELVLVDELPKTSSGKVQRRALGDG